MAYRPRVRVKSGCNTCRSRRKKCDERKPVCSSCIRLTLPCTWGSVECFTGASLGDGDTSDQQQSPLDEMSVVTQHCSPAAKDKIPRDSSSTTPTFNYYILLQSLEIAQDLPSLESSFNEALDTHIIVLAIKFGWKFVKNRLALDPQWLQLIEVDRQMFASCYSPLSRMFQAAVKAGFSPASHRMPFWLVPSQCQRKTPHSAIIDYFPWPSLRQRMIDRPDQYINACWIRLYMLIGWKLDSPFEFDEAYFYDTDTGIYSFQASFLRLILNLSSYSLSKDFLDLYPSLRGIVPQFEPSITLHRVENCLTLARQSGKSLKAKCECSAKDKDCKLCSISTIASEHALLGLIECVRGGEFVCPQKITL